MQSMRLFWDSVPTVPTANHSLIALWRELTLCVLLRPFFKIATGNILALGDCLDFLKILGLLAFEGHLVFSVRNSMHLQSSKACISFIDSLPKQSIFD